MSSSSAENDRKTLLKNALVALEQMQAKLDAIERAKNEPIAIIGMSCRFPGGANSPEAFWQLLQNGEDAIREVPPERWNVADYAEANAIWYGGFLDDIDRFDPQFFGISPREAVNIDPQQRLVLEVAWEALENAGIAPDRLANSLTGVFIGITTNDYAQLVKQSSGLDMDVYSATGTALNAAPGRLAYTLGLQGPCAAVDTACSSSLVALHLACQSLRSRESNMAIAGGVNATLVPENFVCFAGWGMMAPDGRCKTFDARADGFVRGEGCGIIILKRLSDALADGDPILAVVRGSAVNQDGRSSGLTVPNGPAQQAVIRQALVNAGVKPAEVSYIEAHGTGTSLGDPIEVEAIGAALGDGRGDRALMIGSVKTNIGHLESASGIAGLIKVVLSMQHGELPPHLHLQERSPRIPWPNFPIVIPGERTPWTAQPRLAGVSSFGFSGTNAHVVLEEAPVRESASGGTERPAHILTLAARGETALRQLAGRYADYLAAPASSLPDAAYTANTGRARLSHRLAVASETPEEAREALSLFASGQEAPELVSGQAAGGRPKVAFLFTGQGAQYVGMGRELYDTQPTFRAALDECDRLLRPHLERPLLSVIYPEAGEDSLLDHTTYTQPALFALEYALAKLWQSWGIEPSAVMGHSVGEYVAACLAGVFSLEDGLKLIAARGHLMGDLPEGGQMAVVFADEATVKAAVAPYARDVSIAAVNGPENIVISGAGESVQAAVEALKGRGIQSRPLVVSHAFHSPLMEPMLEAFEQIAGQARYSKPRLKLVSNVTGRFADADVTTARYWRTHVREAVRFADAVQALYETGCRIFVEIGPGTTLLGMGQRCLPDSADVLWLPSLRKGQGDWKSILASLGALYVHGLEVDWHGFERDYPRRTKVALPTYPFQRERYWITDVAGAGSAFTSPARDPHAHPLLGSRLNLAHTGGAFVWENDISLKRQAYLADHRVEGAVVVPATAYVEMAISAVTELIGLHPLAVNGVQNRKPLFLKEDAVYTVQTVLNPAAGGGFTFEIYSRPAGAAADWTLHVTGRLEPDVERAASAVFEAVDLDAIMARCAEELTGEDFYRQLSEKGNQWGPNFQGVERLWRGDGEALSLVRVPAGVEREVNRYLFHPAVSDSCGHVLTATISTEKSGGSKGGAFVGGGIDESRFYHHPDGLQLWCYARLRPDEGDENVLIGDVAVFDENGALVSETIGARLWYLDHDSPAPALSDNLDNWFYEIQWQPAGAFTENGAVSGDWLILADSTGVGGELAALLESQGARPVVVFVGETCEQVGEGIYHIRPGERDDFRAVLETGTYRDIVYLWGLDASSARDLISADLAARKNVDGAVRLVQALAGQNYTEPPRIWLVTRGAQPAGEAARIQVAQSPLWGLGRTITLEHSEFWGGLVDLDPAETPEASAGRLWNVLTASGSEDQYAFRDGLVYVPRLKRRQVVAENEMPFQCRSDGSYLITGGMGGLGLEVARWLVEKGARRLILMGRTLLPPRKQWGQVEPGSEHGRRIAAIRGLEAMGASVHLAFVDVSDEAALRDFLETYEAEGWPPVRGVVHAAGVMQYQPLLEQTPEDTACIFQPKATGAWLLHTLLGDAPLDFFALFSSTSALLSSPMMGGYAAANTFLDALAHERRALGLPALSVNWGTWGEAGMATRFGGGDRAVAVMQTISNRQGLEALERLLRQTSAQVGVMPVDWSRWQKLYPAFSRAPLLEQVMREETVETARKPDAGSSVRSIILAAAPEERAGRLQDYLAEQVSRILGFAQGSLDIDQSVSHLGMDSLMAVELKNRVETNLGVVIPMVQLLQGPSVVELTSIVLERLDASTQAELPAVPVMEPVYRGEDVPLSFSQMRMWLIEQMSPGNTGLNLPATYRFSGTLDYGAFEASLDEIVKRHATLRTAFVEVNGQPVQRILPEIRFGLQTVDLSDKPASERDAEVARLIAEEEGRVFDLLKPPLARALLIRLTDDVHVFHVTMHHIVADGWSIGLFVRELAAFYEAFSTGQPAALPDLRVQYADFVYWQQKWLQTAAVESQLAYWRQQLAGSPPLLELPTDYPRPPVQTFRGGHQIVSLPVELSAAVRDFSQRQGVTLFMTLLSAFYVLLGRYTGQDDIPVGSPIAGRNRQEIEDLIGVFINTLVLRADLSGSPTFFELLKRVRQVTLDAYANQDVPFEKLVEELRPSRDASYTPLFQVLYNMLNFGQNEIKITGLEVETISDLDIGSNFDMTLYAIEEGARIKFWLVYNADLFRHERIVLLLEQYRQLLEQAVTHPDEPIATYSLVSPGSETYLPDPTQPLRVEWEGAVHTRFMQQAQDFPDRVALVDRYTTWTYHQLDARSSQLAHYLHAQGVRPGDVVAVYGHRSLPLVWALLSILKAGCAFTVLDPDYPPTRLVEQLELAKPTGWIHLETAGPMSEVLQTFIQQLNICKFVLPHPARPREGDFLASFDTTAPNVEVDPDGLMYILFTSGTTGRPKGILGTLRPVSHFLKWHSETFDLSQSDNFSMLSGLAHDPLLRDIFTPLWVGGTLYIPDPQAISSPDLLLEWMRENRITVTHLTPPLAQLLTEAGYGGDNLPDLRYAFFGGDVLTQNLAVRFQEFAPNATSVNYYGATETPQAMGFYVVPKVDLANGDIGKPPIVPVGRGIADVQLLVLNPAGGLAGIGELGEIAIRTPYLTRGYINDETLTQTRFVTNPFTGADDDRLYRTGDLGRYLPDGNLEFLGRADQQVKIRGFRVELGEIEAALVEHPVVQKALVTAFEGTPGDKQLLAYFIAQGEPAPQASELREFLRNRLPAYMIPSAYIALDVFPLTPNGKIDRRALPRPEQGYRDSEQSIVVPQTEIEVLLAEIWRGILHIEQIGIYDNFFDLGGHSLQVMQVVHQVEARTGRRIDPAALRFQTLGQLAAAFEGVELAAPAERDEETEDTPKNLLANLRRMVSKKK